MEALQEVGIQQPIVYIVVSSKEQDYLRRDGQPSRRSFIAVVVVSNSKGADKKIEQLRLQFGGIH